MKEHNRIIQAFFDYFMCFYVLMWKTYSVNLSTWYSPLALLWNKNKGIKGLHTIFCITEAYNKYWVKKCIWSWLSELKRFKLGFLPGIFCIFITELWPLIDVRISFLLNILSTKKEFYHILYMHWFWQDLGDFFANWQQRYVPRLMLNGIFYTH